jgi:hypothetical protein
MSAMDHKEVFVLPEKWKNSPFYVIGMVPGGVRIMGGTESECACIVSVLRDGYKVITRKQLQEVVTLS